MNERRRFVHAIDQHFHVRIDHHFIFIVIAELEGVVKENVRLNFIIIRIDDLILIPILITTRILKNKLI